MTAQNVTFCIFFRIKVYVTIFEILVHNQSNHVAYSSRRVKSKRQWNDFDKKMSIVYKQNLSQPLHSLRTLDHIDDQLIFFWSTRDVMNHKYFAEKCNATNFTLCNN